MSRRTNALFATLAVLPTAHAWVLFSPVKVTIPENAYESGLIGRSKPWRNPSSFNLETVSIRWTDPPPRVLATGDVEFSDEGLGNGLAWALHKDFCSRLLKLFPEDNNVDSVAVGSIFLTCDDLRETIKRAMDTWAINHPRLYFKDVTDECRHVESTSIRACPHAELFIVPDDSEAGYDDLAAYVEFALDRNKGDIDLNPYSTAGFRLDPGLGVKRSRMTVRAPDSREDFCWYLDATFCHNFHKWNDSDVDVIMVGRIVCAAIFGLSVIFVCWVLFSCTYAVLCETRDPVELKSTNYASRYGTSMLHVAHSSGLERGTSGAVGAVGAAAQAQGGRPREKDLPCGSRRCTNLIDYVSVMPTLLILFSLFWMIFAPVFYFRVFTPCWDCFDFEATIAHEVGHVLGFHHPDTEWEKNLNANHSMGNVTCQRALDYVHLNQTQRVADSIMFSVTKHRSRTCLSNDDLEGLNYLYPSCHGAYGPSPETGEPLCIKAKRQSGWLRLMYSVAIPFFVAAIVIIALQLIVRHHQSKRMVSLEETAERLRAHREHLRRKLLEGAKRSSIGMAVGRARQSSRSAAERVPGMRRWTSSHASGRQSSPGHGSPPDAAAGGRFALRAHGNASSERRSDEVQLSVAHEGSSPSSPSPQLTVRTLDPTLDSIAEASHVNAPACQRSGQAA